jgi:hypothetical protein
LEQTLRDGNARTALATAFAIEQGRSLSWKSETGPHGTGNYVEERASLSADRCRLSVRPDGEPEFEALVRASDGDFSGRFALHDATVVVVLFDPADHDRVAIDVAATKARWRDHDERRSAGSHGPTIIASAETRQALGFAPAPSAPPAIEVTELLTRLADLRDRGALTDDELAAQKAKLLAAS